MKIKENTKKTFSLVTEKQKKNVFLLFIPCMVICASYKCNFLTFIIEIALISFTEGAALMKWVMVLVSLLCIKNR